MWLPAPIYERLPQVWLLFGASTTICAFYIGLDAPLMLAYVMLGVVCMLMSLHRKMQRREYRAQSGRTPLDETVATFV